MINVLCYGLRRWPQTRERSHDELEQTFQDDVCRRDFHFYAHCQNEVMLAVTCEFKCLLRFVHLLQARSLTCTHLLSSDNHLVCNISMYSVHWTSVKSSRYLDSPVARRERPSQLDEKSDEALLRTFTRIPPACTDSPPQADVRRSLSIFLCLRLPVARLPALETHCEEKLLLNVNASTLSSVEGGVSACVSLQRTLGGRQS